MTAGTSDNQTGGAQEHSDLVLSDTDVLRKTCTMLLGSDEVDIPTAVAAVYAYASAFTAGIPSMLMPDCTDPGCLMCSLYVQDEISLARRYVECFLARIDFFCQQQQVSADPQEREVARDVQRWVDACRSVPTSARYQVLVSPQSLI